MPDRRTVLRWAAVAGVGTLAGCVGPDNSTDTDGEITSIRQLSPAVTHQFEESAIAAGLTVTTSDAPIGPPPDQILEALLDRFEAEVDVIRDPGRALAGALAVWSHPTATQAARTLIPRGAGSAGDTRRLFGRGGGPIVRSTHPDPDLDAVFVETDHGEGEYVTTIDVERGIERQVFSVIGATDEVDSAEAMVATFEVTITRDLCWDLANPDKRRIEIEAVYEVEAEVDGTSERFRGNASLDVTHTAGNQFEAQFAVAEDGYHYEVDFGGSLSEAQGTFADVTQRHPQSDRFGVDGLFGGWYHTTEYGEISPIRRASVGGPSVTRAVFSPGQTIDRVEELQEDGPSMLESLADMAGREASKWDRGRGDAAGGEDFCIHLEVSPQTANVDPDGDEIPLHVTVSDWNHDPVGGAIVEVTGGSLGTISPDVAPTDSTGTIEFTYVSGESGTEELEVTAHTPFHEQSRPVSITIGQDHPDWLEVLLEGDIGSQCNGDPFEPPPWHDDDYLTVTLVPLLGRRPVTVDEDITVELVAKDSSRGDEEADGTLGGTTVKTIPAGESEIRFPLEELHYTVDGRTGDFIALEAVPRNTDLPVVPGRYRVGGIIGPHSKAEGCVPNVA